MKDYELTPCQKLDQIIASCGPSFVILHLAGTMGWNSRFAPVADQEKIAEACKCLTQACDILGQEKAVNEAQS